MRVCLCLTAFDRPNLLAQTLENLLITYPSGADMLRIVVDGGGDGEVASIVDAYQKKFPDFVSAIFLERNHGVALATNVSLCNDNHDIFIHIDSDCFIKRAGWAKTMGEFLIKHLEIGLLAPNIPGRYMRIHRPDYDEIEYALGMILAIRQDVLREVKNFHSNGFFDANIHHQYEADLALRIRMKGYRVGIIDLGEFVDLGAGSGDSSRSSSVWRGGFDFLRKWNLYFTGQFRYKSPYCLRWDEMPQNYLWRRLWLSQFAYNERNSIETIQDHRFEIVQYPVTPTKWLLPQTRDALRTNVIFSGEDKYEDVDPELLAGKRNWNLGDLKGGSDGR